jgi:alcohol dehydrogenase class IV
MHSNFAQFHHSQLISGRGSIAFLGTLRKKKAAIVYDGRLLDEAGKQRLSDLLGEGGCESKFLIDIRNEPFFSDIFNNLEAVRDFAPDLLVAFGGGSVIDTAKGLWMFYENPELKLADAFKPFQLPDSGHKAVLVAIPTTSGTGSETTCAAVFTDQETQQKRLMLAYGIMPKYAILDADFTDSLPDMVAAHSGMDALTHALEAAVTKSSYPLVESIAQAAALDLLENLPTSVNAPVGSPEKARARELCHFSATLAGISIDNSCAGLAHALDQMGPYFNLPHGLVCGILLPYTIIFHSIQPAYIKLGRHLGYHGSDEEVCRLLVEHLLRFNKQIGIATGFAEIGVDEKAYMAQLDKFVSALDGSMAASLSPRTPNPTEAKELLKAAFWGNATEYGFLIKDQK